MFSIVLFSARLSATRLQAMPPGLRKSFCRSVSTSAVRRASMVIPGLGKSMAFPLLSREKICRYRFLAKEKAGSTAEALLAGEPPEGPHPGVAEQALRPLLGAPPRRDGPLEQGPPGRREAIGMDPRVLPRDLLEPAVGPHPLQVAAQGRVVELELGADLGLADEAAVLGHDQHRHLGDLQAVGAERVVVDLGDHAIGHPQARGDAIAQDLRRALLQSVGPHTLPPARHYLYIQVMADSQRASDDCGRIRGSATSSDRSRATIRPRGGRNSTGR